MKPFVRLRIPGSQLMGLIVPCDSGVIYSNQCGGTACWHPEKEGVFIPLGSYQPSNIFLDLAWEKTDALKVQEFLQKSGLDKRLEGYNSGEELFEAWVPVRIREDIQTWDILYPFAGRTAILVYENSD